MDFNQRQNLISLIILTILLLLALNIIYNNDERKVKSIGGDDKEVIRYGYTS